MDYHENEFPPIIGTYEGEPMCGRPLGLEFDADGLLWVVDAYLGVFRVDVKTGEWLVDYDIEENRL